MVKLKGLGRGLDALLGGDDDNPHAAATAGDGLRELPIESLQPGKYQPRTHMGQEALGELAASIKTQGVMQPVLVRPVGEGRYEIIAGERRWRAARMAGLAVVPTLVRDIPDQQALAAALIENIQREDLNPLEEAVGIQRLIQEFGLTHQAVADSLGRSRAAVTNLLRLLELAPPVRELLSQGKLDMGHARALLALPVTTQVALARSAVDHQWSVREVEQRVAAALKQPAAASPSPRRTVDRDVARLQEELSQHLGTTVEIRTAAKKGAGKVMITYRTLEQLDALLARLR
ncbi:MAG TPA: ParB/RepB/Spo0J family partition protein [Burkholderiales bacterium]|nr:ParB/RepB/Spo0J family partition protein [Burkholderiales bacterium]